MTVNDQEPTIPNDSVPQTSDEPICPHCNGPMVKMEMPPEAGYASPFMYVCFNDECSYFIEGWRWMNEHYEVRASYRYRVDPLSRKGGSLPVWSKDAMKDRILR